MYKDDTDEEDTPAPSKRSKKGKEPEKEKEDKPEPPMLIKWRNNLTKARNLWQELIKHNAQPLVIDQARLAMEKAEAEVDKRVLDWRGSVLTEEQRRQRQIDRNAMNAEIFRRMRLAQNRADIIATHSFDSAQYKLVQPEIRPAPVTVDDIDQLMRRKPEEKETKKPKTKTYPKVKMYKRPDTLPKPAEPGTQHPTQAFCNLLREKKAQIRAAHNLAATEDLGEERLEWSIERARHKPAHMKNRRAKNLPYINGRHFTEDGNASSHGDLHAFAVKRYIHEDVPMCGDPDDNTTWCEYCDDMSDSALRARWSLFHRTLKAKRVTPDKWQKLPAVIQTEADCRRMNTLRGMMHEEYEHPLLDSQFPLPAKRLQDADVSTQTKISTFVTAPHPDDPKKLVDLNNLDEKDPVFGYYTRIHDPNIHFERFIHPEYMNIYNDKVKINKHCDPGRMMLSPMADQAFRLLAAEMKKEYGEAMAHRTELLERHPDDTTQQKLQLLEEDLILRDFKLKYLHGPKRMEARNILGQDSIDLVVNNVHDLPVIKAVKSNHILEFKMDGQAFDASRCTRAALIKYHKFWWDYYVGQEDFDPQELEKLPEERQPPLYIKPATTSTITRSTETPAPTGDDDTETTANDSTITLPADTSNSNNTTATPVPASQSSDKTVKKIIVTIRKSNKCIEAQKKRREQDEKREKEETEDDKNMAPFRPVYYNRYRNQDTQTSVRMVHFPDFKTHPDTARAIVKQEKDDGSYNSALLSTASTTSSATTPALGEIIAVNAKLRSRSTQSVPRAQSLQVTTVANMATNTTIIDSVTVPIMTTSVAQQGASQTAVTTDTVTQNTASTATKMLEDAASAKPTAQALKTSTSTTTSIASAVQITPITSGKRGVTVRMPDQDEATKITTLDETKTTTSVADGKPSTSAAETTTTSSSQVTTASATTAVIKRTPTYTTWHYEEKFNYIIDCMREQKLNITPANLALRPNAWTQPIRRTRQQPATILITSSMLQELRGRVKEILELIIQQRRLGVTLENLDLFPPSRINTSPYMAASDVLNVGSLQITTQDAWCLRKDMAQEDNADFTIRDVSIIEQLLNLALHALNIEQVAVTKLYESGTGASEISTTTRDIMVEAVKSANDDARGAVVEAYWHLLATRRLRCLNLRDDTLQRSQMWKTFTGRLHTFGALY